MTDLTKVSELGYDPESWKRLFNWKWYKHQMSGWSKSQYTLLAFGLIFLLITGFSGGVSLLGTTATIAGLIGFTTVVSTTAGKPISGVGGFISAIMFIFIATQTGNYSDIIMQLFYIILLDIPLVFLSSWKKEDLAPRLLKGKYIVQTAFIFAIFWLSTYGMDVILKSPRPIIDSLAATIGLVGAVLTVRKFRATYYFWFAQGVMSVILWGITAMQGHAVWVLFFTYVLYILNDVVAFVDSKWFPKKKE